MQPYLLALDFGGTKLSAALLERGSPDWNALERVYSPPQANASYDLQTMTSLGKRILNGKTPAGIGVSFGGPVDHPHGIVRLSHHVPGWENYTLAAELTATFAAPVRVDNDANVAALGEHRFGAAKGYHHICYITVSTGVGAGWILNDQPWRGADSMAGEIGHTVIDPSGPLCLCGKKGCVERLASGPYMAQDALHALEANADEGKRLRELLTENGQQMSAKLLSQAASEGDLLARSIIRRGGRALGIGIGNMANIINPQLFVLGGGVTKSGELFWQSVQQAARQTALPEVHFKIVPAALGDDAPLWGAAVLAELAAKGEHDLSTDSEARKDAAQNAKS